MPSISYHKLSLGIVENILFRCALRETRVHHGHVCLKFGLFEVDPILRALSGYVISGLSNHPSSLCWRAIVHDPVGSVIHLFQAFAQRVNAKPSMKATNKAALERAFNAIDVA